MATLTNTKIKDTYPALLKADDNGIIGASEKVITDGLGNASVLSIGTASASFSGDVDINSNSLQLTGATNPQILVTDTTNSVSVGLQALDASTKIDSTHSFKIEIGNDIIQSVTSSGVEITGTLSTTEDATINGLTIGKGNGSLSTNTAIGVQALDNTTGTANTAIGYAALLDNTTGVQNVAVGLSALRYNTTGQYNTALGNYTLQDNVGGDYNIAIGHNSLRYNTEGSRNTALGYSSLSSNITHLDNTALGYRALEVATASSNTAIGSGALRYNTTGSVNTAIGKDALNSNTTGTYNTAVGYASLLANTTANGNTSVGYQSMLNNTIGAYNSSFGDGSLISNTTGSFNLAFGKNALNANTIGTYNVGIGNSALLSNAGGDRNVALGHATGDSKTSGDDNIYIGYQADGASATTSNEIVIGSGATGNGSNTATYGNSSITDYHFPSSVGNVIFNGSGMTLDASLGTYTIASGISNGLYLNAASGAYPIDFIASEYNLNNGQVNIQGNLAVDTNTLYVDAANNRVGVRESSPIAPLDVHSDGTATALNIRARTNTDFGNILFSNEAGTSTLWAIGNVGNDFRIVQGGSSEAMRIDSSGNVGIGVSPSTTLDVYNNQASGISEVARFRWNNAGSGGAITLANQAGTVLGKVENGEDASGTYLGFQTYNNSTALGERMRIDSSGNVGIGVVPTGSLDVARSGSHNVIIRTTSTGNPSLILQADGRNNGIITYDRASEALTFSNSGSERMRIDSSGNLLFKAQGVSSADLAGGGVTFRNDGNIYSQFVSAASVDTVIYFYSSNGTAISNSGSISVNGLLTAYNTSSDYRLKEDLQPIATPLDRVDALNPINFAWKANGSRVDGFLAHEVAEVVPEAVTGEKDAVDEEGNPVYQGIDQSKIVPLLVGAIKELRAEIELLKSQLS